ncbi:MAG: succinate dehydrogenase assembly factor 2 [Alphaproteobacteria bacterium]|nr:succinate dehydrogenase assembly factor 2 [Alphaproteobacteria bacterium]
MDDLVLRRKRLLYKARHRGTQESDLVLGGFAERHVGTFSAPELDQFEALVEQADAELMDWISGRAPVPQGLEGSVFQLLVNYKNSII